MIFKFNEKIITLFIFLFLITASGQKKSSSKKVDSLITVADKIFANSNENEKFLSVCNNALKVA